MSCIFLSIELLNRWLGKDPMTADQLSSQLWAFNTGNCDWWFVPNGCINTFVWWRMCFVNCHLHEYCFLTRRNAICSRGCFINISPALQILSRNLYIADIVLLVIISNWKFVPVPKTMRTKFQFEILTINVISGLVYFREIIFKSSRNVSERPLGFMDQAYFSHYNRDCSIFKYWLPQH